MDDTLELDSPSGDDAEPALDIGETLASIVKERGDKLGDGAPDPSPPPKPATAPAPAPAPAPEPAPDGRRAPDLTKAPSSWKPELAARWTEVSPDFAAEIHRREEDSARGVASVKDQARMGQEFDNAISPYKAELQQYGVDPIRHIGNLMGAHRVLALGTPAEKQAMFANLAREYRIPLPGAETEFGEPGWVDPQVKALQEKLQVIESGLETNQRQAAAARHAELTQKVTAFAQDPANPHFDEVSEEITLLLKGSGGQMPLEDAYKRAIWANPAVREKLLAKQAQDSQAGEAQKAKEAVEEAEKAERLSKLHLRSKSKQVADTGKTGTIDDTLKETMAAIASRDK